MKTTIDREVLEQDFDVVEHAMTLHRDALQKMNDRGVSGGFGLMDQLRCEQIYELDKAIKDRRAALAAQQEPIGKITDDGLGILWYQKPKAGTKLYIHSMPNHTGTETQLIFNKVLGGASPTIYSNPAYCQSSTPPATVVPHGYKLVPIEPTQAMADAGYREWVDWQMHSEGSNASRNAYKRIYKAMLSAAPTPGEG